MHTEGAKTMLALPMNARHIQALTDGQFFVDHAHDLLGSLHIEPYCRRCLALGFDPRVAVTVRADEAQFRCGHTSGWIKRSTPLELEPLLHALGWNLRCRRCLSMVTGDNARTDAAFTVACSCTVRTMGNPVAASTHRAPRVLEMA